MYHVKAGGWQGTLQQQHDYQYSHRDNSRILQHHPSDLPPSKVTGEEYRRAQTSKDRFLALLLGSALRPSIQFLWGLVWCVLLRQFVVSSVLRWRNSQWTVEGLLPRIVACSITSGCMCLLLSCRTALVTHIFHFSRPGLRCWLFPVRKHYLLNELLGWRVSLFTVMCFLSAAVPMGALCAVTLGAPSQYFDVCCVTTAAYLACRRYFGAHQVTLLWGLLPLIPPQVNHETVCARAAKATMIVGIVALPLSMVVRLWGLRRAYPFLRILVSSPMVVSAGFGGDATSHFILYRLAVLLFSVFLFVYCLELHAAELLNVLYFDFDVSPDLIPAMMNGAHIDRLLCAAGMAKAAALPPSSFPIHFSFGTDSDFSSQPPAPDHHNIPPGGTRDLVADLSTDVRFSSPSPPGLPFGTREVVDTTRVAWVHSTASSRKPRTVYRWYSVFSPFRFRALVEDKIFDVSTKIFPERVLALHTLWKDSGMYGAGSSRRKKYQSGVFATGAGSTPGIVLNSWVWSIFCEGSGQIWRSYTAAAYSTFDAVDICLQALAKFTANSSGMIPLELAYQLQLMLGVAYTLDPVHLNRNPFAPSPLWQTITTVLRATVHPFSAASHPATSADAAATPAFRDTLNQSSATQRRWPPQQSQGFTSSFSSTRRRLERLGGVGGVDRDNTITNRPGSWHGGRMAGAGLGTGISCEPAASQELTRGGRLQQTQLSRGHQWAPPPKQEGERGGLLSSSISAAKTPPTSAELEGVPLSHSQKNGIFVDLQELTLPFAVLSILLVRGVVSWLNVMHFFPVTASKLLTSTTQPLLDHLLKMRQSLNELKTAVARSYTSLCPEMATHLEAFESELLAAIATVGLHESLPLSRTDISRASAEAITSLAQLNGRKL